jgi:hypothetical protein
MDFPGQISLILSFDQATQEQEQGPNTAEMDLHWAYMQVALPSHLFVS